MSIQKYVDWCKENDLKPQYAKNLFQFNSIMQNK